MSPTLARLALLAVAGAGGTLARYGLSTGVQRVWGPSFPAGTAAVNLLGCLLFGAVWAASSERGFLGHEGQTVLLVGFFGAFTTFSSFSFDTAQLVQREAYALAAGNVLLQNLVGMAALLSGIFLGRRF